MSAPDSSPGTPAPPAAGDVRLPGSHNGADEPSKPTADANHATTSFSLGEAPAGSASGADPNATIAWDPAIHGSQPPASNDDLTPRKFGAPPATGDQPSRRFGNYELLHEIARGGMGVVFKARQIKLNRIVALKMILAGKLAGPADIARFYAEAGAAANLQHPNIVGIHEVNECEGCHYYSMDFVDGRDLSKATADGPLDSRIAARYALLIAEAVEHAHSHGVLHRDLKPANVMIDADGQPRVTDFGLAKPLDGGAQITASGAIVGTPSYLPPEQASGNSAGAASDVYSIGAILYQLLCGRPPFAGATAVDTIMQVLHVEPIAPRYLNRLIELDLETICVKCLQKDPKQRYPTARALADDLTRFLEGRPVVARPVGRLERLWRWRRRNPVIAALALAIVCSLATGAIVSTALAIHARSQANEAIRQGERADQIAAEEVAASELARANERQSRQRLARRYVASGAELMDEGDLIGSLPWFVQALRLENDEPARQSIHRFRLGSVLAQCPKPVQAWFHSASVAVATFSPDGSTALTAGDDGIARIWKIDGSQPLVEFRHNAPIHWAEFSPDGEHVVTAGADHAARVWSVATGRQIGADLKHEGEVRHATFGPAGRRVATSSDDRTARVWIAATGEPATPPMVHSQPVHRAAFSPDGERLATAAGLKVRAQFGAGYSQLWSALDGQPLCEPMPHDGNVTFVAYSPDGSIVATTSDDFGARLWDGTTGASLHRPLIHTHFVSQAVFSPDGNRLVTIADDALARVWNPRTGEAAGPPIEHASEIRWSAFSPDGRYLATAELFGIVRVWNLETGKPVSSRLRHTGVLNHVAFSSDGRRLITAGRDGTARLWDLASGEPDPTVFAFSGRCIDAAISPDDKWAVTGCTDGAAHVIDLETMTVRATLRNSGSVNTVAVSDDSRLVLTGSHDGFARLWSLDDLRLVHQFAHDGPVLSASFGHGGDWIATCSADKSARVWRVKDGAAVTPPLVHSAQVSYVAFDSQGERIATATAAGEATVWNALTGERIAGPFMHNRAVYTAIFSPEGDRLIAAAGRPLDDEGGEAIVWDVATGKRITSSLMREHGAQFAMFDPAGKRVLTAGLDDVVRAWDAATGQPVTPPMQHRADVYRAIYSPDGSRIASASSDFTARIWDATDGDPVTPPLRHAFWCMRAMFDSTGRRLLTCSYDRTLRLWKLPFDERDEEVLVRIAELLAGQRLHAESGFVSLKLDEFRQAWESLRAEFPNEFVCHDSQIKSWYARQSMEALQALQFSAAAWNAERSLELDPSDANARLRYAIANAQLADWEKAADSLALLAANERAPIDVRSQSTLASLAANRLEAYRRGCADMIARALAPAFNEQASLVLEACVLTQGAIDDPNQLAALAEQNLAKSPTDAVALRLSGAAALRAGQVDVAVDRLQQSLAAANGADAPITWLYLSLALAEQGRHEEAATWFDKGQKRAARELDLRSKAAPASRLPWQVRLQLARLVKEAEARIQRPPGS